MGVNLFLRMVNSDIVRRAKAAWFRAGEETTPSQHSGVVKQNGLTYVVLRNGNHLLAVYRVKNDGILRRMRRPPATVE